MARHGILLAAAALLLSASPAFAPPPPPPPPVSHSPTPEDLATLSNMARVWYNAHDSVECRSFPETLTITEANTTHVVMDGRELHVMRSNFFPTGMSIRTDVALFALLGGIELIYSQAVEPRAPNCRYSRTPAP